MRVLLTCGGKGFNGQSIEEDVWESVGPFEMAKLTGQYLLWAHEGVGLNEYDWRIEETKSGDQIAEGTIESDIRGIGRRIGWGSKRESTAIDDAHKNIEVAQKAADAYLTTITRKVV